jgi:hypothetical protein
MTGIMILLFFLFVVAKTSHSLVRMPLSPCSGNTRMMDRRRAIKTRRYNFFKDAIGKAFENDRNLSSDKSKGQYDAPGEEFDDPTPNVGTLTETQKKWRETQLLRKDGINPELLVGTSWTLELFLAGVPDKDPSNDLYGSKINISSRDKATGLALPSAASASLTVAFLQNGECKASKSTFTSGDNSGEWKVSDDGKFLRFSLDTMGYTRTVETRGSIQKIYWSDAEEKTIQTKTTYSIPPGLVYGDIEIIPGRNPGTFDLGDNGILRVERSSGLFGIASKMVPCGKFVAKRNQE